MKNNNFVTDKRIFLEGMTSVSALINSVRSGKNHRNIISVFFDKEKCRSDYRRYRFLKSSSEDLKFPLILEDREIIDGMAEGHTHGGIIAEVTEAEYPELTGELLPSDGFAVFIEGLEDPYGLGNTIRTLYACGTDLLILPHRFPAGADGVIARSSAGTSELLPISICDSSEVVEICHSAGYTIYGAGIRNSVEACEAELKKPLVIAIGGEKRGLSSALSSACDVTVRIPYGREFMGSLSSSASAAILAYEVMMHNRSKE